MTQPKRLEAPEVSAPSSKGVLQNLALLQSRNCIKELAN